jgi:hypothetical protein
VQHPSSAVIAEVPSKLASDLVVNDVRRRITEDADRKAARFRAAPRNINDDLSVTTFTADGHANDFQWRRLLSCGIRGDSFHIVNSKGWHYQRCRNWRALSAG